ASLAGRRIIIRCALIASAAMLARALAHAAAEHEGVEVPQRVVAGIFVRHAELFELLAPEVEHVLVGIHALFGHLGRGWVARLELEIGLRKTQRHALNETDRRDAAVGPRIIGNAAGVGDAHDHHLLLARERTGRWWRRRHRQLVVIERAPGLL